MTFNMPSKKMPKTNAIVRIARKLLSRSRYVLNNRQEYVSAVVQQRVMIKHSSISSNRGVPWVTYFGFYSGARDTDCPLTDYEPTSMQRPPSMKAVCSQEIGFEDSVCYTYFSIRRGGREKSCFFNIEETNANDEAKYLAEYKRKFSPSWDKNK